MKLETYLEEIKQFAEYPKKDELEYLKLGLLSEIGEVAGVLKKKLRGDYNLKVIDDATIIETSYTQDGVTSTYAIDKSHTEVSDKFKIDLTKELGDCYWYWGMLYNLGPALTIDFDMLRVGFSVRVAFSRLEDIRTHHGLDLETILQTNIDKLTDRKNRNKIKGKGDNR